LNVGRPWQSTGMDDSRYLECLSADYGDLRDAATAVEPTAPVPSCPGWNWRASTWQARAART